MRPPCTFECVCVWGGGFPWPWEAGVLQGAEAPPGKIVGVRSTPWKCGQHCYITHD